MTLSLEWSNSTSLRWWKILNKVLDRWWKGLNWFFISTLISEKYTFYQCFGSASKWCGSGSGSRLIYEQISYTRCKSKTFNFFYFFIPKKISGRRLLIGLEDQDRLQDVLLQPTSTDLSRLLAIFFTRGSGSGSALKCGSGSESSGLKICGSMRIRIRIRIRNTGLKEDALNSLLILKANA